MKTGYSIKKFPYNEKNKALFTKKGFVIGCSDRKFHYLYTEISLKLAAKLKSPYIVCGGCDCR